MVALFVNIELEGLMQLFQIREGNSNTCNTMSSGIDRKKWDRMTKTVHCLYLDRLYVPQSLIYYYYRCYCCCWSVLKDIQQEVFCEWLLQWAVVSGNHPIVCIFLWSKSSLLYMWTRYSRKKCSQTQLCQLRCLITISRKLHVSALVGQ
jgi:hypothetical protein